ncbi:MAG: CAP family protein [Leptolyngbyaceae cyanobacterium bins.59]|nr:CAP family protein [Leptolyngbyaceae cyanobacterium bins.59]
MKSVKTLLAGVAIGAPLSIVGMQPSTAQSSIDLTTLRNTALAQHNTYRTRHRVPTMTLDNSLNQTAQNWAQYLAKNALFEHSSASQRNSAGENLYVFYTTGSAISANQLMTNSTKGWYNEVSAYNYARPTFSAATGHFTQMVWKNSTRLGCGAAQGMKNMNGRRYTALYVVCHYSPAGNVLGQFPENVLKP